MGRYFSVMLVFIGSVCVFGNVSTIYWNTYEAQAQAQRFHDRIRAIEDEIARSNGKTRPY